MANEIEVAKIAATATIDAAHIAANAALLSAAMTMLGTVLGVIATLIIGFWTYKGAAKRFITGQVNASTNAVMNEKLQPMIREALAKEMRNKVPEKGD